MDIFPFTIPAQETEHFTSSPYDFRPAFLAAKPEDASWYCFDVIVRSSTEVDFVAYGMRDNCYGGIGEEKFRCSATVARSLTDKYITRQAQRLAKMRREAELFEYEQNIIDGYTAEILAAVA